MANAAVFDRTISQIQDRLSLISHRHKLSAHNLANVSTPGYRAKDLSFESHLQRSIQEEQVRPIQTHARHLAPEALPMAAEVEEKGGES